jgi:hypothetical protein
VALIIAVVLVVVQAMLDKEASHIIYDLFAIVVHLGQYVVIVKVMMRDRSSCH